MGLFDKDKTEVDSERYKYATSDIRMDVQPLFRKKCLKDQWQNKMLLQIFRAASFDVDRKMILLKKFEKIY